MFGLCITEGVIKFIMYWKTKIKVLLPLLSLEIKGNIKKGNNADNSSKKYGSPEDELCFCRLRKFLETQVGLIGIMSLVSFLQITNHS